jgi:hypothetical protein
MRRHASIVHQAEAVNAIVEDTTQCKFEATSPASDEVVLFNILQVRGRGGRRLCFRDSGSFEQRRGAAATQPRQQAPDALPPFPPPPPARPSQVLQAVVKCSAGAGLSDDSICKAYQVGRGGGEGGGNGPGRRALLLLTAEEAVVAVAKGLGRGRCCC